MASRTAPKLAIVVPCCNESEVFGRTCQRLSAQLAEMIKAGRVAPDSYLLFVDDGSTDDTWAQIAAAAGRETRVRGLKLSRNYGHQSALIAGLMRVRQEVDCAISIDADLQQDEKAMPKFLDRYAEGCEIVFGVRNQRDSDSWLKRNTARAFYGLMRLMGVRILSNHADYRLTSNKVLDALAQHGEVNIFLRGIIPSLGFRSAIVYHDVGERAGGTSKYSFVKMLAFALRGITAFSVTPIRAVSALGVLIFVFSAFMGLYVLAIAASGRAVPGWASTVLPIYFIGGIQLLSLGLIGEYIGNIYTEVKRRPLYFVEEETGFDKTPRP